MFLDLLPLAKAWNVRVPEIAESHKTVPHTGLYTQVLCFILF